MCQTCAEQHIKKETFKRKPSHADYVQKSQGGFSVEVASELNLEGCLHIFRKDRKLLVVPTKALDNK